MRKEEVMKNQAIAQMLSYGTPKLTKVLKNKIWFAPLNMCCNVLEMS